MSASNPRLVVLLPTYNEAGNLPRMIDALLEQLPDLHVLVIDDDSPDGTGALADHIAQKDARVQVAHRPGKQGLGVAYRFGYRWALDHGYERIIQMDCDFSHDPADVPRILRHLERHPVVVGSRRVEGGACVGWPWYRNIISNAGSWYARTLLRSPVKDLTTGFKGFRRDALERLPLDLLRTDGFGFQIEVTAAFLALGFSIYEVPIHFVDRRWGESKMSTAIFVEAMLKVWQIRREAPLLAERR